MDKEYVYRLFVCVITITIMGLMITDYMEYIK